MSRPKRTVVVCEECATPAVMIVEGRALCGRHAQPAYLVVMKKKGLLKVEEVDLMKLLKRE